MKNWTKLSLRASCVFLDSGFHFILTRDFLFFKQAKVVSMGKPHPMELRQRVVSHVDAGNTHRSAAARFDVSVKFVNDMVKLKQETGSLAPKRQGNPGIGKLTPHESRVREQVKAKGEITLDEMAARLRTDRGVFVDPGSVWRLFQRLGLTHTQKHSSA